MLDIDPVLMVIIAVTFLLVLARLNSCLYKPLLKHIDDRDESIKKDLANAKGNDADVEGMLAEANDVIAKAKKEANAIKQKAYDEAMEVATTRLNEAKVSIEAKYDEFVKNLDTELVALRSTLSSQLPLYKESLKAKISSI
jgi:F-type H+-transporting ATPase subunit b